MGLLTLLPFSYQEVPSILRKQAVYCGGYPELVGRSYHGKELWYSNYVTTYLEKDLRALNQIGDLRDFSRFVQLLAANTAQQLNMSHYARDLGVAVSTIKRWVSILEASYVIFLLPPYYNNFGKRIIKSPKIYFWDVGIVAYFTRITTEDLFENGPMKGALFENYIIAEMHKKALFLSQKQQFYYWRTNHGDEIDLIIDHFHYKEMIEIKSGETFKPAMIKVMESLLSEKDTAYLLYRGERFPYTKQISVLPYQEYFEEAV